jgi:hypothetical protein
MNLIKVSENLFFYEKKECPMPNNEESNVDFLTKKKPLA